MNEMKKLAEAKQLLNKLQQSNCEFKPAIENLVNCLIAIIDLVFKEASESEAGRRWYKNLVEKRSALSSTTKEYNFKNSLNNFNYNLEPDKQIDLAKKYLEEVEKILASGVGRYISG